MIPTRRCAECRSFVDESIPIAVAGEFWSDAFLVTTLGEENTYGALSGRTPSGPVTFARVSTDDRHGRIVTYVGQGRFTDDALKTFGNRAVVELSGLQRLMRHICEHHAAMNASHSSAVIVEAFEEYLGGTSITTSKLVNSDVSSQAPRETHVPRPS